MFARFFECLWCVGGFFTLVINTRIMEEPNEDPRVVPGECSASKTELQVKIKWHTRSVMLPFPVSELYFLIAKFLSGGPLTETAKVNQVEIDVKYNRVSGKLLIGTFFFTDLVKRARESRGESELFLVPGWELIIVLKANARGWGCQTPESFLKTFYICGCPQVLPRRLDWEGGEHAQSYNELVSFMVFSDDFSRLFTFLHRDVPSEIS